MFGRRAKSQRDPPDEEQPDEEQSDEEQSDEQQPQQEVDVDRVLETDICAVEQAVDNYLENSTDALGQDLMAALEYLDDRLALCDAYHARFRMLQTSSRVVGATSLNPIAEDIPSPEFQAQVALVKAAKQEVLRRTDETLSDLKAAASALQTFRQ
jgi:hypothetical protein